MLTDDSIIAKAMECFRNVVDISGADNECSLIHFCNRITYSITADIQDGDQWMVVASFPG